MGSVSPIVNLGWSTALPDILRIHYRDPKKEFTPSGGRPFGHSITSRPRCDECNKTASRMLTAMRVMGAVATSAAGATCAGRITVTSWESNSSCRMDNSELNACAPRVSFLVASRPLNLRRLLRRVFIFVSIVISAFGCLENASLDTWLVVGNDG